MKDDLSVVPGLDSEPVFGEPWQAQAFAMTVALHERGLFGWNEWAAVLSAELAREADYWTAWLAALEAITAGKSLLAPTALAERAQAWRRAADATPHGQPIVLPCE